VVEWCECQPLGDPGAGHAGENVGVGVDHTVYSLIEGRVHFTDSKNKYKPGKKVINVVPHDLWPAVLEAVQLKNAKKRAPVTND